MRRGQIAVLLFALVVSLLEGCTPPPTPVPSLTAEEARHTLDRWNPTYCKVVEFYGFHQPASAHTRLAYLLLSYPNLPGTKPLLAVAQFQLLTRPEGQQEWFLTSVVSHSAGISRRQGWDNLLIPVKHQP